jgi:hypothetical protein
MQGIKVSALNGVTMGGFGSHCFGYVLLLAICLKLIQVKLLFVFCEARRPRPCPRPRPRQHPRPRRLHGSHLPSSTTTPTSSSSYDHRRRHNHHRQHLRHYYHITLPIAIVAFFVGIDISVLLVIIASVCYRRQLHGRRCRYHQQQQLQHHDCHCREQLGNHICRWFQKGVSALAPWDEFYSSLN